MAWVTMLFPNNKRHVAITHKYQCVSSAYYTGFTFKENCPDIRNSRVVDILNGLTALGIRVDVFDPWVEETDMKRMAKINFVRSPAQGSYDAVVIAVAHDSSSQ